jgi:imidazolonepropionase
MKLLINIGRLVGVTDPSVTRKVGAEMNRLDSINDAWLLLDGDTIVDFGPIADLHSEHTVKQCGHQIEKVIDMHGRWLFPSFCDSHTHIIYAGERSGEFLDKINGLSYEEIARRGGGILNSADLLNNTPEDELYAQAMTRINEIVAKGTGSVELKSGYGLTIEGELKMLRVAQRIKQKAPLQVKITFLGAHAVGRAYQGRQADYVAMLCRELIPEVGRQHLADYIDVFCDEGFFTPAETEAMLTEAARYGMKPKIHANELAVSGGVQEGVKHNALSVDHLERITDTEVTALQGTNTIPTMLPGASFFLGMPYGCAKKIIDSDLPLALASDYNPGSSPSGDMRFVGALGCIKMKLTPEQALNATTLNSAAAMELSHITGSIARGKKANFFVTSPLPGLAYLYYAYNTPIIEEIWLNGVKLLHK